MTDISRRALLAAIPLCAAAGLLSTRSHAAGTIIPRLRVIIDNDFAGDPDDLFQTAHHLLSKSVDVRLIVGSHLHAGEAWVAAASQAELAASKARQLLGLMGISGHCPVVAGADSGLTGVNRVDRTDASAAIISEAMRSDTVLPLYYCAGAGLTDLATAWLREPRIGKRLTLVWIGGSEYPDGASSDGRPFDAEYNLTIDVKAAQVIFGQSDINIWQVPRSTYRQLLVSYDELVTRVRPTGPVGEFLVEQIEAVMDRATTDSRIGNVGETYILGDSPLVTLTALQSSFQPDPSSSSYVLHPCPAISDKGEYIMRPGGRPIRIYTRIDSRVTLEDFFAKMSLMHGRAS